MSAGPAVHDTLAGLFRYPDGGFAAACTAGRSTVADGCPAAAPHVERFAAAMAALGAAEREEAFVRTFDLDPACALEVGWHLFGEEYERGAFLVRLRGEMRRLGVAESTELPDHLGHVLAVLGRMESGEAARFARACVAPAVAAMRAALAGAGSPYEHALAAVGAALAAAHGATEADGAPRRARTAATSPERRAALPVHPAGAAAPVPAGEARQT